MADLSVCTRHVVINFFALFFGFIFCLAALGSPMWSVVIEKNNHFGLFQSCGFRPVLCDFYDWDVLTGWQLGTQALMVLCCLTLFLPVLLIPTYFCNAGAKHLPYTSQQLTKFNLVCGVCSAFFLLLSLILYPIMNYRNYPERSLGASYAVAWFGLALVCLYSFISFIILRRNIDVTDWLKD